MRAQVPPKAISVESSRGNAGVQSAVYRTVVFVVASPVATLAASDLATAMVILTTDLNNPAFRGDHHRLRALTRKSLLRKRPGCGFRAV